MRGLDPRIHLLRESSLQRLMDCRVKPGNDELEFVAMRFRGDERTLLRPGTNINAETPAPHAAARLRCAPTDRTDGRAPCARGSRAARPRARCEKSSRQETGEAQRRGRAQALERRDEPLFGRGEIAAEGKRRQQALFARWREGARDALAGVVAAGGGGPGAALRLSGGPRPPPPVRSGYGVVATLAVP